MNSQATVTPFQSAAMSVRDFAALINAGESTAWKLIRERRVRAVKLGRSTRILRSDADAFIAGLPTVGQAA
jgi:excisionase family DNA binding protein